MNVALGIKIIWRMIISKESWWKKPLASKYMNHPIKNLLLENIPIGLCTQVWNLVKKIIPTISKYI